MDSLNKWREMDLRYVSNYDTKFWKLEDEMFFDRDKSKCLFLTSAIDQDTLGPDYVKISAGEKVDGDWKFYYASYPCNYFLGSTILISHTTQIQLLIK